MQPAFPFVDISSRIDALATMITPETQRCWCGTSRVEETYIITRWDVMQALQ